MTKIVKIMNKCIIITLATIIYFILSITIVSAAADFDVNNFACNPNEVKVGDTFSCTATVENVGDQSGHIDTATLYPDDSDWLEDSSYPYSVNSDFDAGESTDITFTSLRSTKSGINGFSKIMLDSVTDTFVDDEGITQNVINVIVTVSNSENSATPNSEVEVTSEVTAGGNIDVDLTFSVSSGGCSIGGQESTKTISGLNNNQKSSKSWTVTMGTSNCAYTITAEATGTGGVATKEDSSSSTISCSGSSCSTGSSSSSSGGGGGGGASTGTTTAISISPTAETAVTMDKNDKLSFTLTSSSGSPVSHTITVKQITATTITLTFASTPFDVEFISGETKEVDIDMDGTNDIEVTAARLSSTQATVKVKKLIVATCTDGIKNQGEVFTDCGGPCAACEEQTTVETPVEEDLESNEEKVEAESNLLEEEQKIDDSKYDMTDKISLFVIIISLLVFGYIYYKNTYKKTRHR